MLAGCAGGDDDGAPVTTPSSEAPAAADPTIPGAAAPGVGWLSLEEDSVELRVTDCTGQDPAATDPSAQKLYELVATGTVDGDEVTVTANEFRSDSEDATALSQTVTVTAREGDATVGLQAKRSFFDERWLDLNERSEDRALFERRGATLVVSARFGPQGSREGDPGVVEGAMIATCPEAGEG